MINKIIDFCKENDIEYIENELMSKHTSFKIGGACDLFVTISNLSSLKQIIKICKEFQVPFLLLGNGSNLLVHDEGIDGVVIKLNGEFLECDIDVEDDRVIYCGSAVKLADLCKFARDNNLSGLEFAYGIPGTVGGAAYMNAGAYDGEMKNVVSSVTYLDNDGNICEYSSDKLCYGYRQSIFTRTKETILFVKFELVEANSDLITEKMEDFLNRRKSKQPLDYPSAGSVFKRPQGQYAGTLIQQCGLKGTTIGGAQVSEKHSGFIINIGNATCKDVLELIYFVQDTVKKETGFYLEREIIDIGR